MFVAETTGRLPRMNGTASRPHVFHRLGPASVRPGSHLEVPIFVSGLAAPVGDVSVSLHVLRQGIGKLTLGLVSPDTEAVLLAVHNGGSAAAFGNSCDEPLVFDDDAPVSIADAAAPIAGPHRPIGTLSAFHGMPAQLANGCWRLVVIDGGTGDVGALVMCVTLAFCAR